jgi:hypothetical protein
VPDEDELRVLLPPPELLAPPAIFSSCSGVSSFSFGLLMVSYVLGIFQTAITETLLFVLTCQQFAIKQGECHRFDFS